ncbi:undecaprenyl pyrophosphate synthetase [Sulfobacillus acidophilus TPY]|nr:undecaprenyl pyrophosphate synthetase [Sulfobacillus acidophilus TPY]
MGKGGDEVEARHMSDSALRSFTSPIPRHIAIIMDGNGRWAWQRGLNRAYGHREGVKALKPIVKEAARLGIEVLTVYAFSTENWRRPAEEVEALMDLLVEFLASETAELKAEGVQIRTIGAIDALPERCQAALQKAAAETAEENRLVLNLALNYGARDEIVRAVNRWRAAEPTATRLDEATLNRYLDTAGLPDPDLVIRSSGELRLSNFLLWQMAYAEIYVTDTLWPDFGPGDLHQALEAYQRRQRRFGGLGGDGN